MLAHIKLCLEEISYFFTNEVINYYYEHDCIHSSGEG